MTDEPTKADLIDRIESLEEQQAELAAEQEQVLGLFEQFKEGQISRRAFLTAVAAVGGVGLVAGRSRAAPSWGSSTGAIGTSSTPLSEGYIQTLKSQSFTTEDGTIGGDPILGGPASGAEASVTLGGGWTTVNPDQPVIIEFNLFVRTDGSTTGTIVVEVDENGGTTSDHDPSVRAPSGLGSGGYIYGSPTVYLPPDAQIRLKNRSDPTNEIDVSEKRKYNLSS
jgi:hypothetical protein